MELGALVCTPKQPDCSRCPVATACAAHQAGVELEIPGKVTKVSYEDRTEFALVIRQPLVDVGTAKNAAIGRRKSHLDFWFVLCPRVVVGGALGLPENNTSFVS